MDKNKLKNLKVELLKQGTNKKNIKKEIARMLTLNKTSEKKSGGNKK